MIRTVAWALLGLAFANASPANANTVDITTTGFVTPSAACPSASRSSSCTAFRAAARALGNVSLGGSMLD